MYGDAGQVVHGVPDRVRNVLCILRKILDMIWAEITEKLSVIVLERVDRKGDAK